MDPNSNSSTPIFSPTANVGKNDFAGSTNTSQKTNEKKKKIILISCIVIAIIALGIGAFALIKNKEHRENIEVSEKVLSISEENYGKVSNAQKELRETFTQNAAFGVNPFANNESREYLDNLVNIIITFREEINSVEEKKISDQNTKNILVELRNKVNKDAESFENVIKLYDLLFEYVNSHSDDSAVELEGLSSNNEKIGIIFNEVKLYLNNNDRYQNTNILQEIFEVYCDETIFTQDYYEYIAGLIGRLK